MSFGENWPPKEESKSINTKDYYKGKDSLYKFAEEHKLNAWEFDCIKRIVRCRFKGNFEEDLLKTIDVIKIYLQEYKQLKQEEDD